jgi:hypothetical protein
MHFSDMIRDLFRGRIITTWISQLYEDPLFGKNFAFAVDTAWECGNLFVPLEAGLHYFGVRSTYILGLQIGLNFVPATKTETRDGGHAVILSARDRAFFSGQNVANGWFFDIYIQGSKKYNFKS